MAKTSTLPCTQAYFDIMASIVLATGNIGTTMTTAPTSGNLVLLHTAGANDGVIKSLIVSMDDSTARVLTFYRAIGIVTPFWPIGTVNIPINSGATGAIANVDVLGSAFLIGLELDAAGKPMLGIQAGNSIFVGCQTTVTTAKTISITGSAQDF
jgi:hypothetical protein